MASRRNFTSATRPSLLIVNDLKPGPEKGRVALWIGDETEASVIRPRQ